MTKRYFFLTFSFFIFFTTLFLSQTTYSDERCPTPCQDPKSTKCQGKFNFTNNAITTYFRYYMTHPLQTRNECITKAILVVHGADMNGNDYFKYMNTAVNLEGQGTSTLVVAPHFKSLSQSPALNEIYWTSQGFRMGDNSSHPNASFVSSFDIADLVISLFANQNNFPSLKEIIITGHSAGGQFTQRYAGLGPFPNNQTAHLNIKFLPSNISSYLYLNEYRPHPDIFESDISTQFLYPVERINGLSKINPIYGTQESDCAHFFNEYKYGLEERNDYGNMKTADQIRTDYLSRNITYFLGDQDIAVNEWVDTSCSANLQGRNRFDRGLKYFSYLNKYYPEQNHGKIIVPGVAHSPSKMYQSIEGRTFLFR